MRKKNKIQDLLPYYILTRKPENIIKNLNKIGHTENMGRMKKFRIEAWFEGRVQGVGFRFKTSHIAMGFDVAGYVENLDDGRVHLVAAGQEGEVRAFVAEVLRVMDCFVKRHEEKADFTEETYKGFNIKL